MSYQFLSPELRVFHGDSALQSLAREIDRTGLRKIAVITGRTLSQRIEMQQLQELLGSKWAGVSASAREHSPVDGVEEAVRHLEASGADGVLAVGGGSAAVTARAAAIRLGEHQPLTDLCTRRREDGSFDSPRLNAPKLPIFALPTTPSTAFAKAGTAVHTAEGERLALFDPKTRARAIFIHPAFVATAPVTLVFSAALNALANAVEALETPHCDPFSEALLMQALRLIRQGLAVDLAADDATRESLVAAAVLCGRGTEQGGTGLASVLAHAIGKRTDAANGIVNAIVLPHTMRFNAPVTGARSSALLDALGLASTSLDGRPTSELVHDLLRRLQAPSRLREIGLEREELSGIAKAAMSDWSISRNPRPVEGVNVLLDLLRQAW